MFFKKKNTMIAVSSFGGHWVQLLKLKPSFSDYKVIYVSTEANGPSELGKADKYHSISDVSADTGAFALIKALVISIKLILLIRPAVVVSTGALPGLIILILAKLILNSKTVWIDSIANSEKLSVSGRMAKYFSNIYLTQWPHLADGEKLKYIGRVL